MLSSKYYFYFSSDLKIGATVQYNYFLQRFNLANVEKNPFSIHVKQIALCI